MDDEKKIALLEDAMELEEGSLNAGMCLEDIDEYDSMAKLAIIVMIEENYGVKLDGDTIKSFVTVQDILNQMK